VLSAGGNGAIQVMYVQSGRHARHFLVNQPAAFDGRLVVGLYREQIVMTKWGTHGILGGGKVCFLETGDMLNGANWIPVTRLKSFLLRADSIIRARSHPEAFAGPTRWKVRPKCLDSTRRAYVTGMFRTSESINHGRSGKHIITAIRGQMVLPSKSDSTPLTNHTESR
jgi:hypothetical protein